MLHRVNIFFISLSISALSDMLFIRTWPKYLKLVTNCNFWSKADCGKLTHSDSLEHLGLTTMQTVFWVFIRISYLVHTVFSMEMPWVSMTYHCHPQHSHKQWCRLVDFIGHGDIPWAKNNKQVTGQTVLTITKALTKTTNCTFKPKSRGRDQKKFFPALAPDGGTPHFQICSGATGHKPGASRVSKLRPSFHLDRPTDRSFSKLALVKSKLRSTMGQQRLQALLLASVEKDIHLELDEAELVARFASKSDRQIYDAGLLSLVCNATEYRLILHLH